MSRGLLFIRCRTEPSRSIPVFGCFPCLLDASYRNANGRAALTLLAPTLLVVSQHWIPWLLARVHWT